jgi:uncharacterized protein (DUF952 family)/8-oxo-dGTP pyrophosphatase MutT (NUDIX family)
MKTIVCITRQDIWEKSLKAGKYTQSTIHSTLGEVGFIHATSPDQTMQVAQRFIDEKDVVFLLIDVDEVKAQIKFEAARSGRPGVFPHIYGPLNTDAVYEVAKPKRAKDNTFIPPAALIPDTDNIAAIILRNSKGQLFAHQRSPHKKSFPNLYGLGAGGHIKEGENPQQAAKRELSEEAGINARPTFLFTFPFSANGVDYQVHVFEVLTDQPVQADQHEWQESGWLNMNEIESLSQNDKLMPDTKLFFEKYRKEYANA